MVDDWLFCTDFLLFHKDRFGKVCHSTGIGDQEALLVHTQDGHLRDLEPIYLGDLVLPILGVLALERLEHQQWMVSACTVHGLSTTGVTVFGLEEAVGHRAASREAGGMTQSHHAEVRGTEQVQHSDTDPRNSACACARRSCAFRHLGRRKVCRGF